MQLRFFMVKRGKKLVFQGIKPEFSGWNGDKMGDNQGHHGSVWDSFHPHMCAIVE